MKTNNKIRRKEIGWGSKWYDNIICNFQCKIPGRKVTVLIIEKKEIKTVS
jgi:hypothetical protein